MDDFPVFNQETEAEDLVSDDKMEDEDPKRFKEARDGDHLMTPFQCDLCHFENCKRRRPIPDNTQDEVALLGIRRANLDALWSRERSTVRSNRLQGKHWISASESAGWSDLALPKRGPFPVEDTFGMQAAVNMLLRSRDVGINSKNIQYETMRKLRSFLSNFVHTTYGGHGDTFMSEDGGGGTISMLPTNSPWFKRFMRGVHKRMGDVWIPDRALMKRELMAAMLNVVGRGLGLLHGGGRWRREVECRSHRDNVDRRLVCRSAWRGNHSDRCRTDATALGGKRKSHGRTSRTAHVVR
jgi:hypothetical protein